MPNIMEIFWRLLKKIYGKEEKETMGNRKHRLFAVFLALAVAVTSLNMGAPVQAQEEYAGYLFAYFTGSSQAIHFAVSADGHHYTPLNDNRAVITPKVGRRAVRDPYIIKGQDGDYYMMATDLVGGNQTDELDNNGKYVWGANTSIVTWHSTDLVNWDQETLIKIRGEYDCTSADNQRMVWAPEAIWDKDKGEYMIYWSMEGGTQYGDNLMIWYSYTKDFRSLTQEPKVLYNPSPTGLNLAPVEGSDDTNCIDADIVEHDGKFYMYYKWSGKSNAGTQLAVSDKLTEGYLPIDYDVQAGNQTPQSPGALCGPKYVEGGDVYKLNGQDKWILIADYNWAKYYGMAESYDLVNWNTIAQEDCTINFAYGDGNPKHGAVIPITTGQYEALWEKWGKAEADGTGSSATTIPHTVTSAYPDSPYADDSTISPSDGNPIAAYDFETVDGNTVKDSSGHGNDAVMVGMKGTAANQWSVAGGVLKLNNSTSVTSGSGSGSCLKLPALFNKGMDTMTISFDVNAGSAQHNNYFTWVVGDESLTCSKTVGKYFYGRVRSGDILGHITNAGYGAEIKADSKVSMSNFGTTINLMYILKPDRISVFRDGVLVAEVKSTVKISDLGNDLNSYFGKSFFGNDGMFNGTFDNIEIYNRALSDEEILEKYPQEGNDSILQKVSVQGASVVKEDVDEANHTITQYVSINNSTVKDWKHAAIDFEVLAGYKISGLKGTYDLLEGAKVTVTSKTDAADSAEWTIKAVPCNNPAIPGLYADPDIDIFDGKYYIYPTTDGYTGWNTQKFHVFSSEDMVEWKDEGVILDLSKGDVAWADTKNCYAWAPAIESKNGKYYFYFCGRDKSTNRQAIGVAVADSPTEPFVAQEKPLMTEDLCRAAGGQLSQAIDPAIYTDEETGDSYMLFGNGANGYNIVKLNEDMISYDADTMYHYPNGTFTGFRESIHVFKKDGKYHFTWSCNDTGEDTYSINYAVADSLYPEKKADGSWGEFKAENKGTILFKVPENNILGTGHHCFVKLPDTEEYYIAYARFGTPLSKYVGDKNVKGCHREICLDKVSFDADGYIEKITPTLAGIKEPVRLKDDTPNPPPEDEHKHTYVQSIQPATANADGKVVTACACGDVKSTVVIPRIGEVKLSAESFAYNKKTRTPTVTVYDRNSTKIPEAYYSVAQPSGRKKVGTYKVTVTFKGNYSGTVTKSFKINPAGVKLTKVSATKKAFTAKWKKGSEISGYEIQYSTSRKFSKSATKTKTVKKTKTKLKVAKLKARKKYYVRIRTYKKIGKTKYVSAWSGNKTVKTK